MQTVVDVCQDWRCLVGRRTSQGSEAPAWPLGTVFTGLHTRDGTGPGPRRSPLHLPAGGAGAPREQQSPGRAQGECERGDSTPRKPRVPELPCSSPGLPLRDLLAKESDSPSLLPALTAQALPWPDAKSVPTYESESQKETRTELQSM